MVDGVYDSDPKKNPDAVKYETLSFLDVLNQGLQVMDSTAASMCKDCLLYTSFLWERQNVFQSNI